MKRKKMFLGAIVALTIMSLFAGTALAGYTFYNCAVIRVATDENGAVKIWLAPGNKTGTRAFFAPTGEENRMMSIALTAMSANLAVKAEIDWSKKAGNTITELQLLGQAPAS